jgi:hypothetical protein
MTTDKVPFQIDTNIAPSFMCGGRTPKTKTRTHKRKGKGKGKTRRLIKITKQGDLKKYGYSQIVDLTQEEREDALRKAIKAYGSLTVLKKVNAIRVLTKRTNPKLSKILGEDVKFIQTIHSGFKKE